MHHDLKLMTDYWDAKMDLRKPWEHRMTTDRNFQVGDTVTFLEVVQDRGYAVPTGRSSRCVTITYVLAISADHCIFTHTPAC